VYVQQIIILMEHHAQPVQQMQHAQQQQALPVIQDFTNQAHHVQLVQ
jgi:hypothetical protein